jgi:uncharacterized Ntn-hydrolase superfamily protein
MHKLIFWTSLLIAFSPDVVNAQYAGSLGPLAHTFSVVARDQATGEMAVAVQSHWFSVGTLVSWGKSGVGVVATQSFVNPAYGPEGLKLMESGVTATDALKKLIDADDGREFRQVAFLDTHGDVSAYTGRKCIVFGGNITGTNFSVQANMMMNDDVVPAMAKAFHDNPTLPLAERVLKTLQAAQEAGGDIRGKQSAVLIVVAGEKTDKPWLDKKIDLRVDDSTDPLNELDRLLRVHRAYEHMNNGDLAVEKKDMVTALSEYDAAAKMFPENLEMKFWKAVALANNNRVEEALPLFKEIFLIDMKWKELTKRLPFSGLLTVSPTDLRRIIDLK